MIFNYRFQKTWKNKLFQNCFFADDLFIYFFFSRILEKFRRKANSWSQFIIRFRFTIYLDRFI